MSLWLRDGTQLFMVVGIEVGIGILTFGTVSMPNVVILGNRTPGCGE